MEKGLDMVQDKYDEYLNVMTCEWCVESGRFYMYQYMRLSEGKWSDEGKENELEELQTERLVFFLFKRINMLLFITFFQFMSDLVNLLSGQ